MRSKDIPNPTQCNIAQKISNAAKAGDANAFENGLQELFLNIHDEIVAEANQSQNIVDSDMISKRGLRQLTGDELKFYNNLIEAVRLKDSGNPMMALSDVDKTFPQTVVSEAMEDMKQAHPLLDAVDTISAIGTIKFLMNTDAGDNAAWGELESAITKEIASGFAEIDLGQFKLSAWMPISLDMMGETFKYAAPIAGALGYSAEDTALAIGLMANAGIKSSQAGTSLRRIMTELNGEVKICGKEIGTVEIATKNADGSMREFSDIIMDCREAFSHLSESEKASAAETLVGKNAMAGFLAIMNATDEDVNKLANSIANCDGESKRMADTMNDNLEGQLTILKSQLQELAISLGDVLVPMIREVVAVIQSVVNWLNSLSPATKEIIVKIALLAAAAGPLLIVISKIGTAIGTVMTWAPKIVSAFNTIKGLAATLGGGLKALWGVMMANPITIIIAAIAALVAAFIYFWNTSEEFRQFWINLWETIKNAVAQFGEAIKQIWNNVVAWCAQAWENIKNVVSVAIQFLAELLTAAFELLMLPWRFLWENFGQYLIEAWEAIKTTIGNALTAIGTALENAWNAILAFMNTILTAIWTAVSTAWEAIKATITSIMNAIKSAVTAGLNAIKSTAQNVWNSIKSTAESAWNGIKSTVSSVIGNIKSVVSSGLNAVKSTASSILEGIKSKFKTIWDGAVNLVKSAVDRLKSLVNFHWELPKLKLPHFKITGSFSLNPPSVPHLSVEWYKKAMENGMILNSPTIFGAAGGRLLGGGEAGPEAIVGVDSLRSMIFDAVAAVGGGLGGDITIPVYIGQRKLDTIVVEAVQRSNYRSGGR